ncbi:MAG: LytR/AlgR family response regulator transcription factor [Tepidiformaceae bacterium]
MDVLIADDEPLARRGAAAALKSLPWVGSVFEASDGLAAAALGNAHKPAIAILDIKMPGLDGLEVARCLRHRPRIVFATAYDKHAITAFEIGAVDYVLKPFTRARLLAAVERARATTTVPAEPRASELLRDGPVARLFVRDGQRIKAVAVRDIERIDGCDDYAALVVDGRTYLVHVTLRQLEERLDPKRFIRAHRSHLVNLDHVVACESIGDGRRLVAVMRSGARVPCSRDGSARIRSFLM